jgi:hypothetical protein
VKQATEGMRLKAFSMNNQPMNARRNGERALGLKSSRKSMRQANETKNLLVDLLKCHIPPIRDLS